MPAHSVKSLSAVRLRNYQTRPVCLEALELVCRHFRALEEAIPPAQWVSWEESHNWRFIEKTPEQLLLQKLARQISGIRTIDLLLMSGNLQEIGVLYRTLDEIGEDVLFVCLGMRVGKWTTNHDAYVTYFWSEDEEDRQPPVRRKSIRSFINRAFDNRDPSRADAIGREIHKTYSDYAHARSAPIMAMVLGPPSRFDLGGIHESEARLPYVQQNPTYFYRCMVSACVIANVVLPDKDRLMIFSEVKAFEAKHGSHLF